ncbi:hypothetical protein NL676_012481 [Syzygium grande]|nr:hypothetical protein NL676_012481 [Syzygium grande]
MNPNRIQNHFTPSSRIWALQVESEFNCTTPLSVSDGTQRGTPTLVLRSLFSGPILAAAATAAAATAAAAHGGPDPPARPVAPTTATISAGGASFPSSSRQCSRFIEPPLQVVVVVVPPVTTPAVEFNCRRVFCSRASSTSVVSWR